MTIARFASLQWADDRRVLIEPPGISPIIADPTFLFPEETPDGAWHLFAHTAFAIHAYSSTDGQAWRSLIRLDAAGTSRSALYLPGSTDGVRWRSAADSRWHPSYNARDGWYKTKGKERIG